jgi:predicted nucleic acid-binding protein
MVAASVIDTNVLVYRFDTRFPKKQAIATKLLREGLSTDSIRIPHQAVPEFYGGRDSGQNRHRTASCAS